MKMRFLLSSTLAVMLCVALSSTHTVNGQAAPRRIEVTAGRFEFTPAEITVKKGEPVVLVLTSADVPHGIRFRELGIETKVAKGQSSELPFTPNKTGDFVGHCSVFCGVGHGKMALTLHVVE